MYPNATAIAAPHALVTLQTIAFPPKGDVTVKARVEAAQAKLLAGLILSFPGGG